MFDSLEEVVQFYFMRETVGSEPDEKQQISMRISSERMRMLEEVATLAGVSRTAVGTHIFEAGIAEFVNQLPEEWQRKIKGEIR